jgi:hypothetical protein
MKTILKFNPVVIVLLFLFSISSVCYTTSAQDKIKALKIGVYDSRIITFAYSRSDAFNEVMQKFSKENGEVMQSGDTAKKIQTAYKMITFQYLLHQQVFSSGSAVNILAVVKDKLPQVAKDSGVSAIVSKWELEFVDPSAEIVDLTQTIARLYNPKEDIAEMSKEIAGQAPVSLEELTVEEVVGMWKQFESQSLGKK